MLDRWISPQVEAWAWDAALWASDEVVVVMRAPGGGRWVLLEPPWPERLADELEDFTKIAAWVDVSGGLEAVVPLRDWAEVGRLEELVVEAIRREKEAAQTIWMEAIEALEPEVAKARVGRALRRLEDIVGSIRWGALPDDSN